jgi:hypothetical protein
MQGFSTVEDLGPGRRLVMESTIHPLPGKLISQIPLSRFVLNSPPFAFLLFLESHHSTTHPLVFCPPLRENGLGEYLAR